MHIASDKKYSLISSTTTSVKGNSFFGFVYVTIVCYETVNTHGLAYIPIFATHNLCENGVDRSVTQHTICTQSQMHTHIQLG